MAEEVVEPESISDQEQDEEEIAAFEQRLMEFMNPPSVELHSGLRAHSI